MKVSAIIATRPGREIDLQPILDTFPPEWERIVWRNGERVEFHWPNPPGAFKVLAQVPDLGPHARFAAIEFASNELIYVQDDDVIVSDPQLIERQWISGESYDFTPRLREVPLGVNASYKEAIWRSGPEHEYDYGYVICNMPMIFRSHYPDSAMVGFGACFHRDLPEKAFKRFFDHHYEMTREDPLFLRESCRLFTTLTHRILVDIPKTDLPYASDSDRLWKQPDHVSYRKRMLTLAREVRDT